VWGKAEPSAEAQRILVRRGLEGIRVLFKKKEKENKKSPLSTTPGGGTFASSSAAAPRESRPDRDSQTDHGSPREARSRPMSQRVLAWNVPGGGGVALTPQ
jgi:hypothetical protein